MAEVGRELQAREWCASPPSKTLGKVIRVEGSLHHINYLLDRLLDSRCIYHTHLHEVLEVQMPQVPFPLVGSITCNMVVGGGISCSSVVGR